MLAAPNLWIMPQGPIAVLLNEARVHRALRHPFLHAMVCRELPNPQAALRETMLQLMPYFAALRPALVTLAERVELPAIQREAELASGRLDPQATAVLTDAMLDHMAERSHVQLHATCLRALGMGGAWNDKQRFAKVTWAHLRRFHRVAESGDSLQASGGLLLGTHLVFPEIASQLIASMRGMKGSLPAQDALRARSTLVRYTEPEILSACEVMAAQPQGLSRLAGGRTLMLDHLEKLFDGLMERAWRMGTAV